MAPPALSGRSAARPGATSTGTSPRPRWPGRGRCRATSNSWWARESDPSDGPCEHPARPPAWHRPALLRRRRARARRAFGGGDLRRPAPYRSGRKGVHPAGSVLEVFRPAHYRALPRGDAGGRRLPAGPCQAREDHGLAAATAASTPPWPKWSTFYPAPRPAPRTWSQQSIVRLRAALARVSCADIGAPLNQTTMLAPGLRLAPATFSVSVNLAVARWQRGRRRAANAGGITPVCAGLPAPSLVPDRASSLHRCCFVLGLRGVCGRLSVRGHLAQRGFGSRAQAAADVLVEDARRLGLGVAIVCSHAALKVTLGGLWLALEVPSLEMVTAGWLLQVVAAGAVVTVRGCGEEVCRSRGRELARLSAEVVAKVAPERQGLVVVPGDGPRALDGLGAPAEGARSPLPRSRVELHEPAATVQAMSVLAAPPTYWELASPVAPLGDVVIDGAVVLGAGSALRPALRGPFPGLTGPPRAHWCWSSMLRPARRADIVPRRAPKGPCRFAGPSARPLSSSAGGLSPRSPGRTGACHAGHPWAWDWPPVRWPPSWRPRTPPSPLASWTVATAARPALLSAPWHGANCLSLLPHLVGQHLGQPSSLAWVDAGSRRRTSKKIGAAVRSEA